TVEPFVLRTLPSSEAQRTHLWPSMRAAAHPGRPCRHHRADACACEPDAAGYAREGTDRIAIEMAAYPRSCGAQAHRFISGCLFRELIWALARGALRADSPMLGARSNWPCVP